jgi:glycerophosphoryl diester phosphodiesterase
MDTDGRIIAHRGASAYAPENTVPAFQLGVEQGAGWVEIDLQMTRDGELVVLHDDSLERTTDVAQRFPSRAREVREDGHSVKRWMLEDFALDEIRCLDAGSWFVPAFRGTPVPTFGETVRALRGRAGLFIEIKSRALPGGRTSHP